jgi:aspartyl-tRNA(Asn)/glutamyl-tRNA(Gln) amidotransferase subunit C
MVKLDKAQIKYLTQLCRIECTEEEQNSLLKDLGEILNYMEQLNDIDTSSVPPCHHVLEDVVNVLREDIVGDTMPREVFLSNAPLQIGGMIRVPTIIKQN